MAMLLDLALLGTGGMLPLPERWLASVLLRCNGRLILFDCGEGTQISLRALGWGLKDIDLILISHLHGDHVGGLPGLLLSQGNAGRTDPVRIAGPAGLSDTVAALRVIAPYLPFAVERVDLAANQSFEQGIVTVRSAPADHSVPCVAFRLEVTRGRRFLPERARALGVPQPLWGRLQRGEAVVWDGSAADPDDVLGPPRVGLAVALITDTRPTPELVHLARGADLLVCEGTYGDDADLSRARQRKHLTFREAATLAAAAGVRQLLLTHFSPALANPEAYAHIARHVFPNTLVGHDHLTLKLTFPEA